MQRKILLISVTVALSICNYVIAFSGMYDGSDDSSIDNLTEENKIWIKDIKSTGFTVYESEGFTTFKDNSAKPGDFNLIYKKHSDKTFLDNPTDKTWYFEARIRFRGIGADNDKVPQSILGFADEGGKGRSIVIGWFKDSGNKYRIRLGSVKHDGIFDVKAVFADFNYIDDKWHTYRVEKRISELGMRIFYYLDGNMLFDKGLPYSHWSEDSSDNQGFIFKQTDEQYSTIDIDFINYGTLKEVAMPKTTVKESLNLDNLSWKSQTGKVEYLKNKYIFYTDCNESANFTSCYLPVISHTEYKLCAKVKINKDNCTKKTNRIKFIVRQYREDRECSDKPDFESEWLVLNEINQEAYIEFDFYVRFWSERISINIISEEKIDSFEISDLTLYEVPFVTEKETAQYENIVSKESVKDDVLRRLETVQGVAELKKIGSRPRLFIDGKMSVPAFDLSPISTTVAVGNIKMFADAGVNIHVRGVIIGATPVLKGNTCWTGKGLYNFQKVKDQIWRVLRSDPNGYVILHIMCDPYYGWGKENPDEVCQNEIGQLAVGDYHLRQWGGQPEENQRYLPSLYSQKLLEDMSEMLKNLINYIESSEVGNAVIGYSIAGLNDAQFVNWAHWDRVHMDDYSPGAKKAFRNWLNQKYNNNISKLKRAWKKQDVTFDNAEIPVPTRRKSGAGLFIDWKNNQDVIDFQQFYTEGPVEMVLSLAETVKKQTQNKKTVQIYYAGPMTGAQYAGGLGKALASPYVDLFQCPAHYWLRLPGYTGGSQAINTSVLLNKKIFITEQDWRSWLSPDHGKSINWSRGRAPNAKMHNEMVRRESGMMLAFGQGTWWFDIETPSFASKKIMSSVSDAVDGFKKDLKYDDFPESDVAFFVGEDSLKYFSAAHASDFLWYVLRHHRDKWNKSGVPYHLYLQNDLLNENLPNYKVYIFLTPQYMSEQDIEAVNRLKNNNKTLVFLHAPGILNGLREEDIIKQITGIVVEKIHQPRLLDGNWIESSHPIANNLSGYIGPEGVPLTHGTKGEFFNPWVAYRVKDKTTVSLAKYSDSNDIGIALKQFDNWMSIFCGIPQIEPLFLFNIASTANAWVVSNTQDAVYANQHFLTIHSLTSGIKKLKLKYPSKVTDITTNTVINSNTSELEFFMPWGQTMWFSLEKLD